MPIVLLNFARNLKITRFTIDVLTQRLEHLESPRDGTSEEWSRFVCLTHESVAACDQLYDALRGKFSGMQSLDTGSIAFLNAGFAELHPTFRTSQTAIRGNFLGDFLSAITGLFGGQQVLLLRQPQQAQDRALGLGEGVVEALADMAVAVDEAMTA
jgi:hypothetical protein